MKKYKGEDESLSETLYVVIGDGKDSSRASFVHLYRSCNISFRRCCFSSRLVVVPLLPCLIVSSELDDFVGSLSRVRRLL